MVKKYIVRLTKKERQLLQEVVRKVRGSGEKIRRAQILLKADSNGPQWTDEKVAEAFCCRVKTVENVRQRFVLYGLKETLNGKVRREPATPKLLNGKQEAKIIATRLGAPPKGYANWSLRLLASRVVELKIVDSVSHETLRKMLKKTA